MAMLASLWLPILLSAVAVFVASSLIHMLFKWHNRDYRKLPNEDAVRAAAHVQARMLGASSTDEKFAAAAAIAALRHPLLREAAAAEHRREAPIVLREPDGTLVEGVLDLAFRREKGWIVVDFKTDHELADAKAAYEAQVRLYCRAVSEATGIPAEGALLLV